MGQAPLLLLSLFVGAWVDRWRARTVMVVTDAGRTLILGAAAVAGLLGWLGLPALLVVAFAVGALSVFFDVAYQAHLRVAEVFANVVRHVPDRRCTLLLLRQASGVRVEVTDSSPQLPSTPAELLTDAESGRGLALTRWSTSGAWSQ